MGVSDLKYVAIFSSCSSSVMSATDSSNSAETQKSRMKVGSIFVFLDYIHVTSSFEWICDNISEQAFTNHLIMRQPISNLVDLENLTDSSFTLNFIDELEDTLEKWKFTFESNSQIIHLLKSIDDIWQKIFCISLLSDDQMMKWIEIFICELFYYWFWTFLIAGWKFIARKYFFSIDNLRMNKQIIKQQNVHVIFCVM